MSAPRRTPAVVLGSTGYVAGELLRLLAGHPRLELCAAVSRSRAGSPIAQTFPHLVDAYPDQAFAGPEALDQALAAGDELALFSALPHGESAARIAAARDAAAEAGTELYVADVSADLRLADQAAWEATYGQEHPAPQLLGQARCAPPDLDQAPAGDLVAHPGCFTTAVTLCAAPLVAMGLVEPTLRVVAITGATGSGRSPRETTHLPERHSNLFAYKPLTHRHRPEMEAILAGLGGGAPQVLFVPHSGPFSRGIHATVQARLVEDLTSAELVARVDEFYSHTPFVSARLGAPRLKDVVGSNRCALGYAVEGRDLVGLSVIDNLIKGAAGGAMQWMNRMLGVDEASGLTTPALGWT